MNHSETPRPPKHLIFKFTSLGGLLMLALVISTLVLIPGTQAKQLATGESPGSFMIRGKGKTESFCLLEKTTVNADIAGFGCRVTVKQRFKNPLSTPIEAIYTFPLPSDAAVDQMRMKIGDRVIEGTIKKREEAQKIYQQALTQGKTASLLDQERPNIFTQSVGNIMPNATIDVELSYVQLLKYEAGNFEFMFPMVVGPRYTQSEADASKITPPITPKGTRTGANVELNVNVDAGMKIEGIKSELHEVNVQNTSASRARIQLAKKDEIPNRDFILKIGVAGNSVKSGLLTYADPQNGGFFTLILMPPKNVPASMVAPKEVIFVMDQSGSQSGFPISKSRILTRKLIENLGPNDTFNVLGFNTALNWLWPTPKVNNLENRIEALNFVDTLDANGGTNLIEAVKGAYMPKPDPDRRRLVVFNTDGYVGNDFGVLDEVTKNRGNSRMFTFGIGNSVNRFLIDSMSLEGKGDSEIVTLEADASAAVDRFLARTQRPILIDPQVQFDGIEVLDMIPAHVPDVFSEKPIIIKGRYSKAAKGTVTLSGLLGGSEQWSQTINVNLPAVTSQVFDIDAQVSTDPEPETSPVPVQTGSAIATLWARSMIDEVMRRDWMGVQSGKGSAMKDQVTRIGLSFHLMTQFTSFVAVDEKIVNKDGKPTKVRVPIEMADGVSYEGIFGLEEKAKLGLNRGSGQLSGGQGLVGGGMPSSATYKSAAPAKGGVYAGGRPNANLGTQESEAALQIGIKNMTDSDIELLAGKLSPKTEAEMIAKLSAAEKERYLWIAKVEPDLRKTKSETVRLQLYLNVLPSSLMEDLAKAGLKVTFTSEKNMYVTGQMPTKHLRQLSQVKGIKRISKHF